MKSLLLPSVVASILITSGLAYAGAPETYDIEIVSVVPRNPEVKPAFMSVPAFVHHETVALANPDDPSSNREARKLTGASDRKAVPLAADDKK